MSGNWSQIDAVELVGLTDEFPKVSEIPDMMALLQKIDAKLDNQDQRLLEGVLRCRNNISDVDGAATHAEKQKEVVDQNEIVKVIGRHGDDCKQYHNEIMSKLYKAEELVITPMSDMSSKMKNVGLEMEEVKKRMEDMDNSANLSTRATQSLQDNVLPFAELIKSTASQQKEQSEAQRKFQEDMSRTVADLSLKVDKHSDSIKEVKQKFGTTEKVEEIAKDTKSVLEKLTVTQKYTIAAANLTRSLRPKTRCTYELRVC